MRKPSDIRRKIKYDFLYFCIFYLLSGTGGLQWNMCKLVNRFLHFPSPSFYVFLRELIMLSEWKIRTWWFFFYSFKSWAMWFLRCGILCIFKRGHLNWSLVISTLSSYKPNFSTLLIPACAQVWICSVHVIWEESGLNEHLWSCNICSKQCTNAIMLTLENSMVDTSCVFLLLFHNCQGKAFILSIYILERGVIFSFFFYFVST